MKTVEQTGVRLTRRYVMGLFSDAEAATFARGIALREFSYGKHYVWDRGEEYFTEEGIAMITGRLESAFPAAVAVIVRAVEEARVLREKQRVWRENQKARRAEREAAKPAAMAPTPAKRAQAYWWDRD